ncbi:MAG: TolC family protein [Gemmatimonadota bacterium]
MNAYGWRALGALALLALAAPAAGQIPAARDTVELSLGRAVAIALEENPVVHQAAFDRSAAGAERWSAYGTLLPQFDLEGQLQRSSEGSFVLFGSEFITPKSYSTVYQWNLIHSMLDAGRDLFRIKSARASVERAIARYDAQELTTTVDVEEQFLTARREQALATQAERELERLGEHVRLADARYEVGAVTKSDVLQANLSVNQGEVSLLQARQRAEEALLALRSLLGGALPPGPVELTGDFVVFRPVFEVDELVNRATEVHPAIQEVRAQERIDEAGLWIARSRYIPSLQLQYSLSRSVTDTSGFEFGDFDKRSFAVVSLNWPLFGRFERYAETSRANATLRRTRAEERRTTLALEEQVRVAHSRLLTALAAHEATAASVEFAREDLRLAEARYRTGAGSFVDLLDARVRASQAETDLITATYDFYLALVALEQVTGMPLMPEEAIR